MSSRLTERQQLKLLQEEAKAAEEGTTMEQQQLSDTAPAKPATKSSGKANSRNKSRTKDEEVESKTSSPSMIGGWTEAMTEKTCVKVLVIPPAPELDTKEPSVDMDDVFNVEDSSDDEVVSSRSKRRFKRKRRDSPEEEEGSDDENADAKNEKDEAVPTKSEGGIPRLKKKAAVAEDTNADLKYISKSSLLSKSSLPPPATAVGSQPGSNSTAPGFPGASGYRGGAGGAKRPESQPPQRPPHPSAVRPAGGAGPIGPAPGGRPTHPPSVQQRAPMQPMPGDVQPQQPPSQTRGHTETERRVLQDLERLVSDVMEGHVFARKEPGGAIDMSGSFLRDEENRFDFYDTNENGEIVFPAKIPIFPEDFPPGKTEWPLRWWGIVDPSLAPESKSPVRVPEQEGWNASSGGPPPPDAWNRGGNPGQQPSYTQQGQFWPQGGGGRGGGGGGWAPGPGRDGRAGREERGGAWRGGRGGGPPSWAPPPWDGRRPEVERRPPGAPTNWCGSRP